MTDEELIKELRKGDHCGSTYDVDKDDAADRIEQLVNDVEVRDKSINFWIDQRNIMAAKLAKAVDALRLVRDACDEGQMVLLGTSGMTIDAQIRRSVYNQVPAWPIEEARVVLEELENYNG